jgi:hypothetical protein
VNGWGVEDNCELRGDLDSEFNCEVLFLCERLGDAELRQEAQRIR